ncbi:rRNA maturation RNase YbeY [Maritimibacter sp. 55A14]|uniref:rRNA maturation RNase YbeY n=1 Tax=Maritimibacter sp. 55A14 TaxID=2174844 RepID=UPI000D60FEFF|nr:rRNA maturation RNase YbeY [Maritimibacter sp. 55A14]PWE31339.1 rRNA maturation RNase YbeY [Maritimibacter sp. 55A14]
MPDLVETVSEDARWDAAGIEALAARACGAVLEELRLDPLAFEIGFLACDDARIATLNADFRGKPAPTNVLSWPAEDLASEIEGDDPHRPDTSPGGPPAHLGDIAIAWETCAAEAADQGKPFEAHCLHLLVHGCLHLLGYDHISDKDAALMEGLERRILAKMGLPDPY